MGGGISDNELQRWESSKFFVEDVVAWYGAPMKIISDKGTHFHNKLISETCWLLGISQNLTTAYHPQTDGLTERFNQTLMDMLSKYVRDNSKDWDELIPYILFGYRTAIQESTRETPFYLMFRRDPVLPIDVALWWTSLLATPIVAQYWRAMTRSFELARDTTKQLFERAQHRAQQNYEAKGVEQAFEEGDQEWLFIPVNKLGQPQKIAHLWAGPFWRRFRQLTLKLGELEGNKMDKWFTSIAWNYLWTCFKEW
jgi:hypothetical protein